MSIDTAEYLICWAGIAYCIGTGIATVAIYLHDQRGPLR